MSIQSKDALRLSLNAFQDKQQSISEIGNISNLANIAYNKAIESETSCENLHRMIKKVAEMTISNEANLKKITELFDNTRNMAIETKNMVLSNDSTNILKNSNAGLVSNQTNLSDSLYKKLMTEIIEAKQIALETKTSTEKYKQNIELKLESHNINYNSNIKQLNTKCDNLLSLATNNLNKSNNNLLEFVESKHRLDEHLNNLSKPRKFKLYGSINKLLSNNNFMGTMDQDYIYMCTTNIHLIKLNDQLIFKTIDQKFNVPLISKPKKIADIDTNLDYTKMKFLNYDIIDESDSYITEQALYIIPRNWSQMKDINEIIINNYIFFPYKIF